MAAPQVVLQPEIPLPARRPAPKPHLVESPRYRLAIVSTHPIQNWIPLYRQLASDPEISLRVFYASDFSVRGGLDAEFGIPIKWDIPMLEGYDYTFLGATARGQSSSDSRSRRADASCGSISRARRNTSRARSGSGTGPRISACP